MKVSILLSNADHEKSYNKKYHKKASCIFLNDQTYRHIAIQFYCK